MATIADLLKEVFTDEKIPTSSELFNSNNTSDVSPTQDYSDALSIAEELEKVAEELKKKTKKTDKKTEDKADKSKDSDTKETNKEGKKNKVAELISLYKDLLQKQYDELVNLEKIAEDAALPPETLNDVILKKALIEGFLDNLKEE